MTGLFIIRRNLAPELEAVVSEVDKVISSAEAECRALSGHLAHFSFLADQRRSVEQRRREIDPETGAAEMVALGREMQTISGWMISAARVFAIDYFETLNLLLLAGNRATNAHKIRAAIDVDGVRKVIDHIKSRADAVEVLRHAAAHGSDYGRQRPNKKVITEPGEAMGFDFVGGRLTVGFSLNGVVANASFEGKLHELPITLASIDEVLSLKADLFTALVVWPDFIGQRAEPFAF